MCGRHDMLAQITCCCSNQPPYTWAECPADAYGSVALCPLLLSCHVMLCQS
jgi:hypothetical protein